MNIGVSRRVSARVLGTGLAVVAILAFLALLAWGTLNRSSVTGRSGITRVQKPAPDFELPRFDGGDIVLSEHIGRPIVINFWASWCPPCRDEAVLLESLWRTYQGDEVLLVGIDVQDEEQNARAFLREFDITYPNGADVDGHITIDYGVIGLPVTFFVNRQGIVDRRWVGAIREAELVAWVDDLVAGAAPSGDREKENLDRFFQLERDR